MENAHKYSTNDKHISISLKREGTNVLLEVSDNGIGIAKNERTKVFDQFYRIGNEDTRDSKGTGLGLYIVNQIVTAHNGKIKIIDNPGGGTIFQIKL